MRLCATWIWPVLLRMGSFSESHFVFAGLQVDHLDVPARAAHAFADVRACRTACSRVRRLHSLNFARSLRSHSTEPSAGLITRSASSDETSSVPSDVTRWNAMSVVVWSSAGVAAKAATGNGERRTRAPRGWSGESSRGVGEGLRPGAAGGTVLLCRRRSTRSNSRRCRASCACGACRCACGLRIPALAVPPEVRKTGLDHAFLKLAQRPHAPVVTRTPAPSGGASLNSK